MVRVHTEPDPVPLCYRWQHIIESVILQSIPLRYVSVTTPAQLDLSAVSKLGPHVRCLYLAGVGIKRIPAEVFTRCPGLEWLDLRDNRLMEIAEEITAHPRLKVGPGAAPGHGISLVLQKVHSKVRNHEEGPY